MRLEHKCVVFILLCVLIITNSNTTNENEEEERFKRQINSLPLVFPYGGTFKFIAGFTSPIANKDNISLGFLVNFQYQYPELQNITQVSKYYAINTISREQREADLWHRRNERLIFYRSVSGVIEAKGLNGQDCLLRAICEAAQYPVEEEGLVGEIIHILLTPDYGHSPFEGKDPNWEEEMSTYIDAATAGRQMFDCPSIYNGCPEGQGVLELISILRDE